MFREILARLAPTFRSMGYNFDADESAFFERELETVLAKTYDIKFPELIHRNFVPVSNEVSPGAATRTYRQFDRVGTAKFITDNAKDIPRADVLGLEFTGPVREMAIGYGWTLKELMSAQMAGRPLNALRASAARRATEELLDNTASFGAADFGIPTGFLNDAAVPITAAGGIWSARTPAQNIADVSAAYSRVAVATLNVHKPDTLILPDAAYTHISTTPRSDTSDLTTLRYMLENFPFLTAIEPWYRLNAASAGGGGRAVLYKRDPEILGQDIPLEFTQLAPQEQGLELLVPTWAMTAGTRIHYPLAVDYTDDVS